jgi:hypothetical protein
MDDNTDISLEQSNTTEEKDFPASPKEADVKIDDTYTPESTDQLGNVIGQTYTPEKIEIPQIKEPEQPIEEKTKVEKISETKMPELVDEMGNVISGEFNAEKAAKDALASDDELAAKKERLEKAQKEIYIMGKGGQQMSLYDFLNKKVEDINLLQSMVGGVISGTIKIPYAFPEFVARAIDYFGPPTTKTGEGKMAELDKWFKNTWLGIVQNKSEEAAKATAIGQLTEAFTEIFGAARLGTRAVSGATKIASLVEEMYSAAKTGRLIDTSVIMAKAGEKANILNNLTGWKKWTAIGIGGGGGIGFLVPSEDIGTLGEIFGGPTKLDRVTKPLASEDAARFFNNQLKFGAENSIFTIGVTGAVSTAKLLATQGKELAYSNNLVERFVDKFASYFRPRRGLSPELLQQVEVAEGKEAVAQLTAKDLIDDIDRSIINIRAGTEQLAQSTKLEEFLFKTNEILHSEGNVVQGNKIVFKGFNNKQMKEYENYLKDIGVNSEQISDLKTKFFKVRDSYNQFLNEILQGKNLNVGAKEFNQIMSERFKNILTPEYRIFTEKSIIPYYNYKPSLDSVNEIKNILTKNILSFGGKILPGDIDILVNNIVKDAELSSKTKAPEFKVSQFDFFSDKPVQIVNMADNFVGGKFVPTPLIKTQKQYEAFQKFFGIKQDPRFSIVNVMEDLSEFARKDAFANNVKDITENLTKNKQRAIAYKTEIEAQRNFNPAGTPKLFIRDIVPLNSESKLGKLYTNPLNGLYTSKEFSDALNFVEKLPFESLNQNPLWRYSTTIPKALVSSAKTVLSLFAHIRNPLQNIALTVGTGNAFKNPKFMYESAIRAFNSVQPQLLYKNLPKDQAFYKFLLENKVVGSSTTFNDAKLLFKDASLGGELILQNIFGKFGTKLKNFYRNAQNAYLAEDDWFKVFNFLAEHDNLRIDYSKAVEKGLIKTMPSDLDILTEAAGKIRDMFPNYDKVGTAVKALRYSPIGNFPSWTSEMFRNSVAILENSINEIKDPVKSFTGWKRLVGFTVAAGGIVPAYIEGARGLYGITRGKLSSMRKFLYDYEKDSTIVPSINEDGKYMYQNLNSYPYTSITDIFQPVIAGMENVKSSNLDDPLIQTTMIGLGNGFVKATQPFLNESIWNSYFDAIFKKDGMTQTGYRIWNQRAPLSEKWEKAVEYGFKTLGFGSTSQINRIYLAATGKPGEHGEKYQLSDELLGVVGFRRQELDPIKRLGPIVGKFTEDLNNDSKLFTSSEILKGGMTDPNAIIQRYILANKQRYETMSKMQQVVNAGIGPDKDISLNVDEKLFRKKFEDAQQGDNFRYLKNNQFNPFTLSQKTKGRFGEQFQEITNKFDDLEYTNPLDDMTKESIKSIRNILKGIPLNQNFDDFINIKDWLIDTRSEGPGTENKVATAPLPPQPSPNVQVVQPIQQVNQGAVLPNGLTRSETALLRPEEQLIKLNQRQTGLPTGQV